MSRTRKTSRGRGSAPRRITVRGVQRDPVDVRKLSRALIQLAQAQAEADAQRQAGTSDAVGTPTTTDRTAEGGSR
jgi:hypothetical protein